MYPFSCLPESQHGQQNHDQDNQHFPAQLTQPSSSSYYQQSQQHCNAYNPPPAYAFHQVPLQVGSNNPVPVAAVVVLSQLTQAADTGTPMQANLGAASLHHGPRLVLPSPASGYPDHSSGRGGRRSFRGNGRRYDHRCLLQTGDHRTGPEGGKGDSQCLQQHGASSVSQQKPSSENVKSIDVGQALASQIAEPPMASHSTAVIEKGLSRRRPPQSSSCELCRIECNSVEMLEEHKNGKRHKKNLQKIEEPKSAAKPGIEKQNLEKPSAKPENEGSQQPIRAAEREEKKSIEIKLAESVGGKSLLKPIEEINREKHTEAIVEEAPRSIMLSPKDVK